LNSDQTRKAVREIRKQTDQPFGANASLMFPGAAENAKVLLEEKVPVINFALGKGDWIVRRPTNTGARWWLPWSTCATPNEPRITAVTP
jgi:enoyl-[acyl-carrier protein] reductase II